MHDADVVIIGAGLTGLRAALEVTRAGLSVLLVEGESHVGGRLKTTYERGAVLDHGFQVLLTGYPELALLPDLSDLECRSFWAGARMRLDSKFYDLLDPRRHPRTLFASLRSPIASMRDLVTLAFFVQGASRKGVTVAGVSTADAIDRAGFSELFKGAFLRPFLRGVLLDPSLASDAGLARFYLRMFSLGSAALPARGIQAFPELLADRLGRQHILLNSTVSVVEKDHVVLQNGEQIAAKRVVCAVDALAGAALRGPEQTVPVSGTSVVYFLAEQAPFSEPLIVLNGTEGGPIQNIALVSNVQPSYAPKGQALIAVSVIGNELRKSTDILLPEIRKQLHRWFGPQTASWEAIKVITVPNAVPARPRLTCGWTERGGVFYAGDYLSYGSQNGALAAGRAVAQHLLTEW
jgi:phytoene dehydrogenase-like protein